MRKARLGKLAGLTGLAGLAVALAACSSGVPQKDYDALKQQAAAKEQELASVKQQLAARGSGEGAGPAAQALRDQITAKDKEIADLKAAAASGSGGKTPLVWTENKPLPPPAPTPTPRPPGFVAPTPVPPDDVTVNTVFPFTFYIETLTGHQVSDFAQFPSCVVNAQFRRGAHLVWRFEVFDTSTGKRLTSLDNPTVKLILPSGQEIAARFARKGGTGPWTWVAAWDVPKDYPLGSLDYTITVSKGGKTGTFDPKLVALVNKDRGIDQRVQIIP